MFVEKEYAGHESGWEEDHVMTSNIKIVKSSWEVPIQSEDKPSHDNGTNVS